jgi:hypothetical protein
MYMYMYIHTHIVGGKKGPTAGAMDACAGGADEW